MTSSATPSFRERMMAMSGPRRGICHECGLWTRENEYHDCYRFKSPHPLSGLVQEMDGVKQRQLLQDPLLHQNLARWLRKERWFWDPVADTDLNPSFRALALEAGLPGARSVRRMLRGEMLSGNGEDPAERWLRLVKAMLNLRCRGNRPPHPNDLRWDLLIGALERACLPNGADGNL